MTFANPLPWWGLGLVLALAGLVAWQAYRRFAVDPRRRAALMALRFITLLLLVVFLMRPVARGMGEGARDAVVPILVDTSRSMGIDDAGGMRRIDRAREIIQEELEPALGDEFQLEVLRFGDRVEPGDASGLAATARRSDLAGALADVRERYRGRAVAGILLLSDGGDTGGSLDASAGEVSVAPIYAMGVGLERVGRDREVLGVTAADAVLDDSRVDLAVSAVSHGHDDEPFELRLLENGRPIEVRRTSPAGDGVPVREIFRVAPRPNAPSVYTVEVTAASGDLVPENNARSVLVRPPARKRRVLFIQGAPGFEHSFINRAWASDTGLEVDSTVRKGKNEQGNETYYIQASRGRSGALASGYPTTREDLFAYDAIVLANVDGTQLTRAQMEMTRAFVAERGGGVLVMGARSFHEQGLVGTGLEDVVPLDLTGRGSGVLPASAARGMNRVALTEIGAEHPVMQLAPGGDESRNKWDALPPLAAIAPLGGPRPGASVLAVAAGPGGAPRALVAVQRYGEGRSMVFTGEASWRWRMMLPASDRTYETFWRQAVRWLALPASDPIAVIAPAAGSPGDTLPLTILVRNAAFEPRAGATVDVRVSAPDGRIETLRAGAAAADAAESAGRYVARFRPEGPGVYRIAADVHDGSTAIGTATTAMLVGGADLEMSDPRLNVALLQRVALASGGRLIDGADTGALAESLRAAVPTATLAVHRDLWHNAWSFAAIVVLLGAEWVLRRRWGLR